MWEWGVELFSRAYSKGIPQGTVLQEDVRVLQGLFQALLAPEEGIGECPSPPIKGQRAVCAQS